MAIVVPNGFQKSPFNAKFGQGFYISQDQSVSVVFGYRWYARNSGKAFIPTILATDVDAFVEIQRFIGGKVSKEVIFEQKVGSARLKSEANSIGRKAVREVLGSHIQTALDKASEVTCTNKS